MLFVFLSLWFVQKSWSAGAHSLNVIYNNPYRFHILADNLVVEDDTIYKILPDTMKPIRVLVNGDTILFITGNVDYPLILYFRSESTFTLVQRRGAYSDYDPVSSLVIPISPVLGSRPFYLRKNSQKDASPMIYGPRVFTFADSLMYIDGFGNLKTSSGYVILSGVRDALPYGDRLLVLTNMGVVVLDRYFMTRSRVYGNFQVASAFTYEGRDGFLLSSGDTVYLFTDFIRRLFISTDSISCMAPVDYDMDNSLEILVSSKGKMYLYDEDAVSGNSEVRMQMIKFPGYGYPSTCGGMYGARLSRVDVSAQDVRISYVPGGWRVYLNIPSAGPLRVYVVNSRGIKVFEERRNVISGDVELDIMGNFTPGTYSIVVEGGGFRVKRTVIWKGR